MAINFISSEDSDDNRTMHGKNNNVEIMMGNETNVIIEESSIVIEGTSTHSFLKNN